MLRVADWPGRRMTLGKWGVLTALGKPWASSAIPWRAGSSRRHNQAVPGFRVKKDGGDVVARFGIQHVVVVQSGGGIRVGGGVAFPQQGRFPQVKVRPFHGKDTAVGDIGRVHRSIGGGPYLQSHGINGRLAGQVPVSVIGEVDDCGCVRIRLQTEMKGFFHHGVGGYHFQVAGVIFLTVCGVQGQNQRIAPGFLHLPDFAVEPLDAAVQVVGAVVDGHGAGIPVNGEPAFCDAIRDTAANRTAITGVFQHVFKVLGPYDHVHAVLDDGDDAPPVVADAYRQLVGRQFKQFYRCAAG